MQSNFSNIENPVKMAIKKEKNHPNIERIKGTFGDKQFFSFELVSLDIAFKDMATLNFNEDIHPVPMYHIRLLKHIPN